jgi:hemoglobin
MSQQTIFQQIGGYPTLERLVDEFYTRLENDPEIRRIFPADMGPGKRGQLLFLVQYFGGPPLFNQERGASQLRMRHMPFEIGRRERDIWLKYMLEAIDVVGIAEPARTEMRDYFKRASTFMINKVEDSHPALKIINQL